MVVIQVSVVVFPFFSLATIFCSSDSGIIQINSLIRFFLWYEISRNVISLLFLSFLSVKQVILKSFSLSCSFNPLIAL